VPPRVLHKQWYCWGIRWKIVPRLNRITFLHKLNTCNFYGKSCFVIWIYRCPTSNKYESTFICLLFYGGGNCHFIIREDSVVYFVYPKFCKLMFQFFGKFIFNSTIIYFISSYYYWCTVNCIFFTDSTGCLRIAFYFIKYFFLHVKGIVLNAATFMPVTTGYLSLMVGIEGISILLIFNTASISILKTPSTSAKNLSSLPQEIYYKKYFQ